jgi:CrcB protein
MSVTSWLAVGGGAATGAWLRWWLGTVLNPLFPTLPLGTLAANLIAGFLMGIAMEVMARNAAMPAEMRLLVTTGFLGGLSTFSAFSGEIVSLLSHDEYLWAGLAISAHVIGSVALTIAGIFAVRLLIPLEAA